MISLDAMQEEHEENNHTQSKQSFFKDQVIPYGLGITIGAAAVLATVGIYNADFFQESREYIEVVPNPVKLFFAAIASGLVISNLWLLIRVQKQEGLLNIYADLARLRCDHSMRCIDLLSKEVQKKSDELQEHKVALNKIIVHHFLFQAQSTNNHEALSIDLQAVKNMYSDMQDEVKIIKEKQEMASFLTNIFDELRGDIRYREALVRSEVIEQQRIHGNRLNLGGVE